MDEYPNLVDDILDALAIEKQPEGRPKVRPVHTIGIGATGTFVATEVARNYCVAEHFQGGRIPVTVRFSNGLGSAVEHDGWSDVRGMATRFHLPSGAATDLVAMTLPEFFTATPEEFLKFLNKSKPQPIAREPSWRKILEMLQLELPRRNPYPGETVSPFKGAMEYADENPRTQLAVVHAADIGAPVSYARATYHAVHAFAIRAPDGARRFVRFSFRPVAGVLNTAPDKGDPIVDSYLKEELRKRLDPDPARRGPARFTLMMAIGEPGDDPNDSSRPWPPHRRRVMMGELALDTVPDDQDTHCEKLSFNPWLLVDGIEPSDDPVLRTRRDAYQVSSERRGGAPCPFSRRSTDGGQ